MFLLFLLLSRRDGMLLALCFYVVGLLIKIANRQKLVFRQLRLPTAQKLFHFELHRKLSGFCTDFICKLEHQSNDLCYSLQPYKGGIGSKSRSSLLFCKKGKGSKMCYLVTSCWHACQPNEGITIVNQCRKSPSHQKTRMSFVSEPLNSLLGTECLGAGKLSLIVSDHLFKARWYICWAACCGCYCRVQCAPLTGELCVCTKVFWVFLGVHRHFIFWHVQCDGIMKRRSRFPQLLMWAASSAQSFRPMFRQLICQTSDCQIAIA